MLSSAKDINKGRGLMVRTGKEIFIIKDFKERMDPLEETRKAFLEEANGSENEP